MNMRNKVVLVTGSTDGIGRQTALELAKLEATVLIHARTQDRASAALKELKRLLPSASFDVFIADFEVQCQIHDMAAEIQAKYDRIGILINNAAIYSEERKLTADTIEKTFAVNHLAHFLLTHLLLPLLQKAVKGRIINISSVFHYSARFDSSNLQGEKSYDGIRMYNNSKLHNLFFTYELAEILKGDNISVNALHPGIINTKLVRLVFSGFDLGTVENGASLPVFLASSDDVENSTGKYYQGMLPQNSSDISHNKKYQKKLWETSEKLTLIRQYRATTINSSLLFSQSQKAI